MRVLVIAKDFPAPEQPVGGIFVMRQIQALAPLGHDVSVVRIVPHAPPFTPKWRGYRSIPDFYVIGGIEVYTIRAFFLPRMHAMEYLPLQVDGRLRRLVERLEPDLIHAHCVIPSGHLAGHQRLPSILTAHGSDAYDWAWRRAGLHRAAVEGVSRAGVVVAVSDFIRTKVRALFERDVRVVYNGADEALFAPADRIAARAELGIAADRFVVAFTGRPAETKGAFDLVAAAAGLRDVRPLVLFAGPSAAQERALADAVAASGVDARLLGTLPHERLARVLAAADVFCLPSYREGLPLAVCEAMLSGRPIVATPVGGIPEIVTEGHSGYLVPPGNAPYLGMRLRAIAENPALAVLMGEKAHAFARRHLTWRANAIAYDALYRTMLSAAA